MTSWNPVDEPDSENHTATSSRPSRPAAATVPATSVADSSGSTGAASFDVSASSDGVLIEPASW